MFTMDGNFTASQAAIKLFDFMEIHMQIHGEILVFTRQRQQKWRDTVLLEQCFSIFIPFFLVYLSEVAPEVTDDVIVTLYLGWPPNPEVTGKHQ